MAKYPTLGKVKTRLGESIGHRAVAYLYQCFLKDTIEKVERLGVPFFIYYTPENQKVDFERLLGRNFAYVPQYGANFGDRIYQGFKKSKKRGYASAIALASDVPDLPVSILDESIQKLEEYDSVIGPSYDGGYYLIGLNNDIVNQNLFQDITWSTELVFIETMKIIEDCKISYHKLPTWRDIDLVEDLQLLLNSRDDIFHTSHTWKKLMRLNFTFHNV